MFTGGAGEENLEKLEGKLDSQLNTTRSTPTDEGVADADVAGCGDDAAGW
jgi:hypothetical protein